MRESVDGKSVGSPKDRKTRKSQKIESELDKENQIDFKDINRWMI